MKWIVKLVSLAFVGVVAGATFWGLERVAVAQPDDDGRSAKSSIVTNELTIVDETGKKRVSITHSPFVAINFFGRNDNPPLASFGLTAGNDNSCLILYTERPDHDLIYFRPRPTTPPEGR